MPGIAVRRRAHCSLARLSERANWGSMSSPGGVAWSVALLMMTAAAGSGSKQLPDAPKKRTVTKRAAVVGTKRSLSGRRCATEVKKKKLDRTYYKT